MTSLDMTRMMSLLKNRLHRLSSTVSRISSKSPAEQTTSWRLTRPERFGVGAVTTRINLVVACSAAIQTVKSPVR